MTYRTSKVKEMIKLRKLYPELAGRLRLLVGNPMTHHFMFIPTDFSKLVVTSS